MHPTPILEQSAPGLVENVENIYIYMSNFAKEAAEIKYSQHKITYKRDPNYFQSFQYNQYHVFH